nr:MAG TPA: hypothetical protein [Bacteriophage sp.]
MAASRVTFKVTTSSGILKSSYDFLVAVKIGK